MSFKEDTCFYLDDISIPHQWQAIKDNINNKLYFKIYNLSVNPNTEFNLIATIESGNYTGLDLATEIQTKMNTLAQPATTVANMFVCAYVLKTDKITISMTSDNYAFRIITQPELKTIPFTISFDRNKPNDVNEVLSNMGDISVRFNKVVPFISGPINLQPFNNIYIHSTNLGNYNSIGPMNESTIVKKVPVSADYNRMIFDQCVLINDYNDCSGQTIKTLYFKLLSSRGDVIPLHGCNWSFSVVFSRANPDI